MAETESSSHLEMSENDMNALKDALCDQQILLQKLYAELDQEREASASAASEALSMILRLQGEKAAVTMEASQYKRMAEEKMYHAEECLAIFEDSIYQKEMEIASLEYQIQAYRFKLLSVGCNDLGIFENRFPDSLLMQKSELINGESGCNGNVRRMNSLPPMRLKDYRQRICDVGIGKPAIPESELILETVQESKTQESNVNGLDHDKRKTEKSAAAAVDIDSCWEHIRKLNERVKELSDGKERSGKLNNACRSFSLASQASIFQSLNRARSAETSPKDRVPSPGVPMESKATDNSACSSTVLDVFEVPKGTDTCKTRVQGMKEQHNINLEDGNRLGKPDSVSDESWKSHIKDEKEQLKKIQLFCANQEAELSKAISAKNFDCNLARVQSVPSSIETQAELQQLSRRIKRLEDERRIRRQEIIEEDNEQMRLLKAIQEQLSSIQSDIKSWKTKESSTQNDKHGVPKETYNLYDPVTAPLTEVSQIFFLETLSHICSFSVITVDKYAYDLK